MAKYLHEIDLVNASKVVNLPDGTAANDAVNKSQLDTKQNILSVAAGSTDFLTISGDEISVSQLLVTDTTVSGESTIADYVTASYTGTEHQSGDIVVLTGADPVESYVHNGGSAGTTADFTLLNNGSYNDTAIRGLLSGADGIDYNSGTGAFAVDLYLPSTPDLTAMSISGATTPTYANGEWAEVGDFSISGASTSSAVIAGGTGHRMFYRDDGTDYYVMVYNTSTPAWVVQHYDGGSSFSTATNGATLGSVGGSFQAGQSITFGSGNGTISGLIAPNTGTAGGGTMVSGTIASGNEVLEFIGGKLAVKVLDEDTLVSDSDSHVPTQQSVKAYVDAAIAGIDATAADLSGSYVYTDATGGPNYPAAGDSVETAVAALDGDIRFIVSQLGSGLFAQVYRESSVALTAATPYVVDHGTANDNVIIMVNDATTGEMLSVDIDVDNGTAGELTITSAITTTVNIVVVG